MKKKKLKEFLDMNTKGENLDHLMKEIIHEKFNTELKSKYSQILDEKLNVQRSATAKVTKLWKYLKIAGVIILLLGVLLGGYYTMNYTGQKGNNVQAYLAQNQLLFQDLSRNDASTMSQPKLAAYLAFNKGEYQNYLGLISNVTDLSSEDRFFTAYAKMMEQSYSEALEEFEAFCTDLQPEQKFYSEAHLYKAICLLKTNEDEFFDYYNSLDNRSWLKKELNQLL